MAKQTEVRLIDDLDGSEASGTVTFGLDGTSYEIELSDDNRKRLEEALTPYVEAGRKAFRGAGRVTAPAKQRAHRSAEKASNGAIREWARENGLQVSDRGRISREVIAEYNRLNPQG